MKTSEIIECLEGRKLWADFFRKHQEALSRMNYRNDGAITSGDIGLVFDKTTMLEVKHLNTFVNFGSADLWTLANLVALCGFEARSSEIEENLSFMCEHTSDA